MMELGQRVWSMAHLPKIESPESFKTHKQIKQVIHNPNNQHSVLPGMLDLGQDTGTIGVEITRKMVEA